MGTHRRMDRWLPAAIEELAAAATAAAQHNVIGTSTTATDDDLDICPTDEEVVRFLCQPAPWPLAAILNDLCQRCEVDPPECITEAMDACQPIRWDVYS
jgi:hypothetical protein